MDVAFVVIFYHNLVRTAEDENECNIHNRLLCKGTRVKKRQRKKMANVHLPQMHKLSFETTFSSTPLQQRLLQHCYNTISTTLSSTTLFFAASLQHRLCNIVFNTTFALEWWQGLKFLVG